MTKTGPVIAIDGPSGVGKSTVSRRLAGLLGFRYINTGAMYRAFALAAHDKGIDLNDEGALKGFCGLLKIVYDYPTGSVVIDGVAYSDKLKSQEAGELASIVSTKRAVREFLVAFQRSLGEAGKAVMEGRDIGTAVFPDADVKIFLDAPHEVRAERRRLELKDKGAQAPQVSKEILERDRRDSQRAVSPLKAADDAVHIDTGSLGIDEVVQKVFKTVNDRLKIGNTRS